MKSAQFVDYQTRVLSFTVPVRANHVKIKNKLTMMLQLTSTGGVLPSFELQSRVDTVDYEYVFTVLILNLSLVIMFIVNELIEAYDDGFVEYFSKCVQAIGTLKRKCDACSPHQCYHTSRTHTLHFSPRPIPAHSMWNLMDWSGFMLFMLLYFEFNNLRASLLDTSCNGGAYLCTQMGFHDDWQQFKLTSSIKFYLSAAPSTPAQPLLPT